MVQFIKTKLQLTLRLSSRAALCSAPKTQPMDVDKRRGTQQTKPRDYYLLTSLTEREASTVRTFPRFSYCWIIGLVEFRYVWILQPKKKHVWLLVSGDLVGTPVRHMSSKKQTCSYLAVSKIVQTNLYGIHVIFRLMESVQIIQRTFVVGLDLFSKLSLLSSVRPLFFPLSKHRSMQTCGQRECRSQTWY